MLDKKIEREKVKVKKTCKYCKSNFETENKKVKYCSHECSAVDKRKVERPSKEQLLKEIEESNYCAVGRKYGVSDNAIRKWLK